MMSGKLKKSMIKVVGILSLLAATSISAKQADKPNILILWGDDVGMWNISAYHRGMMGGTTPNIDRIAKEGMIFMDHYGHASCTAGRAAFILGQYPIRTGLSTVGLPGAPQGIKSKDVTIAELLKPLGYATGQFGKNHLGDRDEMLPTNHGFDEFHGILYHLNAGQYSEQYDYPKEKKYVDIVKTRGIIHSWAQPDGTQKIEDLGPWGPEVQRTLDEVILENSKKFIQKAIDEGKPFFVWHNFIRTHFQSHLSKKWKNKTGFGLYANAMAELDSNVGELLQLLDDNNVTDNTIIMFSTDNGAATTSWPDGGNQPFHGEKGAGGWEGGFRVPMMVKWKGHIPENVSTGEFMTMEDWMPTLLSWVGGDKNLAEDLRKGKKVGDKTYKVYLDGYDQSDMILNGGKTKRMEFYYWTETTLHGLRFGPWKMLFVDQENWFRSPQTVLSSPIITNLKLDPFERMYKSRGYPEWAEQRSYMFGPAAMQLGKLLKTFEEFPADPSASAKFAEMGKVLLDARKSSGM